MRLKSSAPSIVLVELRGGRHEGQASLLANLDGMSASVRRARPSSDLQRSTGGLLIAVGALVVLMRSAGASGWTELERVLVISAPVVLLYALACGRRPASEASASPREASPWRSVLLVTAVLLSPVALLAALHWLGVDTGKSSVQAAVAAVAALLAFVGARRARAPYAVLIAGLALLVAWLIVWSKIVDHPSTDDYRWFLLGGAALLFAFAVALEMSGSLGVGEMTVAGAVGAVLAGAIGVVVGAFASLALAAVGAIHGSGRGGTPEALFGDHGQLGFHSGLQSFGWDLYLLVVSLLLIWVGSRVKTRGLGYLGAIGLLAFAVSAGLQITKLEAGHSPGHSLLGWPVILIALGLVALVTPMLSSRRRRIGIDGHGAS
jgi:hypothetical protein